MQKPFFNILKLKEPVVAMAPMDGVTDPVFRHLVCKYSKPSFVVTEFVNVEGLARGATKMLRAFYFKKEERPILGQLFGVEPDSFYKASVMLCHMGFDGIDINMGCPVNKIAKKGSGAALIRTPELAGKIIKKVMNAVEDFQNGITMKEAGLAEEIISEVSKNWKKKKGDITVSVKTRIGYDKDIACEWIKYLLEQKPDNITMHGRTLKQLYTGKANWESLEKACELTKDTKTSFIGNGDVESMSDAREKIKKHKLDGVMVGRAVLGNPWFFSDHDADFQERINIAKEHIQIVEKTKIMPFQNCKKHLLWYLKGFDGAKDLRIRLMQSQSCDEAISVLDLI